MKEDITILTELHDVQSKKVAKTSKVNKADKSSEKIKVKKKRKTWTYLIVRRELMWKAKHKNS